ncbi:MAG: hypothetical protein P4L33_02550 [Capsulimonadaceae bacterium]|nr:hypothetical protein [Capsulimonadaceae bacterium]
MKLVTFFAIALSVFAAFAPRAFAAGGSGIYIQEYWAGVRAGYWIGNAGRTPLTLELTGGHDAAIGPLVIAPGGAVDVDAAPVVGGGAVRVYVGDNVFAGTFSAPTAPPAPAGSSQSIVLRAPLGGGTPLNKIWFELDSVPTTLDRSTRVTMYINGAQGGFVVIRAASGQTFAPARIAAVECAGLPVRRADNGDWYIDARKTARTPLQAVTIDVDLAASRSPSMVLIDAGLEDFKHILTSFARGIYIAAPPALQRRTR